MAKRLKLKSKNVGFRNWFFSKWFWRNNHCSEKANIENAKIFLPSTKWYQKTIEQKLRNERNSVWESEKIWSEYEKLSVENSNILRQNKNLEEKLRESEEKHSKNFENWNQEYNHRAIEILKVVEPQMMSRIDKIVNSDRKRKKSKKNKDSTEMSSFETSHAMVIYVSDSN